MGKLLKPYYQDEWVTIYHGDCREILPSLPMVDLVLTDIPFNVNLDYESYKDNLSPRAYGLICEEWFNALRRVEPLYIVKSPTKTMPIVLPIFDRVLGYVWSFIQYSPNATTHGAFNLSLYCQYLIGGELRKRPNFDVIVNTNNKIVTKHPAEMPTAPIKKILTMFADSGDIMIDPFMGSGSFIRASKDLGRKCIGIEIEEKYCEIAARRCSQMVFDLRSENL